jgi:predicted acetyltransferase
MNTIRRYENRDRDDIVRIWQEVGWIDDSEREARGLEALLDGGDALVGEIDGEPECCVHRLRGRMRYLGADLPLSVVSAVTTSRIARRRGLATEMTGRLVLDAAADGAALAVLGMFEQGFYERFGFGSGSYTQRFNFDPGTLEVSPPTQRVVRLSPDDAAELHDLMQRAERSHGGVCIDDPSFLAAQLHFHDELVALGIRSSEGRLTGAVAGTARSSSHADLETFIAETPDDAIELFGLIKDLSDQWLTVEVEQPPGFQLQDLIDQPIRQRRQRRQMHGAPFHDAVAWWQVRILDLEACWSRVPWRTEPRAVVLRVTDPLGPDESTNLTGDWTVHLGPRTTVERGASPDLPVLSGGIGPISRLWLGVRSATTLARSTDLDAPDDVLVALDAGLGLPTPEPGVYF